MTAVAIDEWMGASPIYTKRMQRCSGSRGHRRGGSQGMQLDIGAPPSHGLPHGGAGRPPWHVPPGHCGALMDVEPLGDDFVVAMCTTLRPHLRCHRLGNEPQTADAAGTPASPPTGRSDTALRVDRHDRSEESDTPFPTRSLDIGRTKAAELPLAAIEGTSDDGYADYARPLDPTSPWPTSLPGPSWLDR